MRFLRQHSRFALYFVLVLLLTNATLLPTRGQENPSDPLTPTEETSTSDSTTLPSEATPIPPPVAAFTPSVSNGDAPLTVIFSNQSSGDISGYSWDFGDGATSGDAN